MRKYTFCNLICITLLFFLPYCRENNYPNTGKPNAKNELKKQMPEKDLVALLNSAKDTSGVINRSMFITDMLVNTKDGYQVAVSTTNSKYRLFNKNKNLIEEGYYGTMYKEIDKKLKEMIRNDNDLVEYVQLYITKVKEIKEDSVENIGGYVVKKGTHVFSDKISDEDERTLVNLIYPVKNNKLYDLENGYSGIFSPEYAVCLPLQENLLISFKIPQIQFTNDNKTYLSLNLDVRSAAYRKLKEIIEKYY